jgi:hypothetical protein
MQLVDASKLINDAMSGTNNFKMMGARRKSPVMVAPKQTKKTNRAADSRKCA